MSGTSLPVDAAVAHLRAGGLLGFPTETSWGLAADATSERAVAALQAFKGRDVGKPISVLLADPEDLDGLGVRAEAAVRSLLAAFWPGPLTLVARCTKPFAPGIAGPGDAVGFRCSPHAAARGLARRARDAGVGPLTATSLNLSGAPECVHRGDAELLGGAAVPLLAGDDAGADPPSTVVDVTGARPRILREGAIPRAELARFLPGELAA